MLAVMDLLTRDQWGASLALGVPMRLPAIGVHVHHSVTDDDDDGVYEATGDVVADMQEIERIGGQRFGRFSYSFCGHPSGWVGEGAGLTVGAHTAGWNSTTFGYCLIGNYDQQWPTDAQVRAFLEWRAWAVANGWLRSDHWVEPHRARKATACPGSNTLARWPELTGAVPLAAPAPSEENDDVNLIDFVRDPRNGAIYIVHAGVWKRHVTSPEHLDHMQQHYAAKGADPTVRDWSPIDLDPIPTAGPMGDVDEAEVARQVLAVLTPEAIADAIPEGLATDVADVLALRLAG